MILISRTANTASMTSSALCPRIRVTDTTFVPTDEVNRVSANLCCSGYLQFLHPQIRDFGQFDHIHLEVSIHKHQCEPIKTLRSRTREARTPPRRGSRRRCGAGTGRCRTWWTSPSAARWPTCRPRRRRSSDPSSLTSNEPSHGPSVDTSAANRLSVNLYNHGEGPY